MSLLNIQVPSDSASPAPKRAVGIDLGTTHSLVALAIADDIHLLSDQQGAVLLPSVVQYAEATTTVGRDALAALVCDPKNTIQSAKRAMGSDKRFETDQGQKSPVTVSSEILSALMQRVHQTEPDVTDAVITVPAYFDEAQRQATKRAAEEAGITVLRLLNEPTAAAVAYGLDNTTRGKIMVVDLGGGTFDVSFLNMTQGVLAVLATGGDTQLGGDDMDHLIVSYLKEQLTDKCYSEAELPVIARQLKEDLTDTLAATATLSSGTQVDLSRDTFNDLIETLISRMLTVCQRVLFDAKCKKSDIDAVVLVGGATKIPYVQSRLEAFFEQTPLCNKDPSTVVALGAAKQAAVLSGNDKNSPLLLDVIPLSLGLEMMGGVVEKILPRNTQIPATVTEQFTTYADNQTGLVLHVLQGERELVQDCRSLGQFELTGIPPMLAGKARIEVTFQIDLDGLLMVSAKEATTDQMVSMTIKPTHGLQENDIMESISDAIDHAEEDVARKKFQIKRTQAEKLMTTLIDLAQKEPELLSPEQAEQLNAILAAVKTAIEANSLAELKSALTPLEQQLELLMTRRMNKILQQTVSGKSLDEVEQLLS